MISWKSWFLFKSWNPRNLSFRISWELSLVEVFIDMSWWLKSTKKSWMHSSSQKPNTGLKHRDLSAYLCFIYRFQSQKHIHNWLSENKAFPRNLETFLQICRFSENISISLNRHYSCFLVPSCLEIHCPLHPHFYSKKKLFW